MTFWGTGMDTALGHNDPKRKFRWKVQIGDLVQGGVVWYAKTVDKPKMTISADAQHKFLGHTFKFPGSVTWEDINVTLVDPADGENDAAKKLLEIVQGSGYRFPTDSTVLETISKPKSVTALGTIVISQINGDNEIIEEWLLHNPFFKSVEFDTLDYASDDLSEITLGIVYDWAELQKDATGSDPELFRN